MKNATLKNSLKVLLVAGSVCAAIPAVYGQGIGTRTLDRMLVQTPQKLTRGEAIYDQQCASCHGDNGDGNAALGQQLGAGALNTTLERGEGVVSIYNVVARGLEDAAHPVFNNLAFQDQWAVSHYVHSLATNRQPDPAAVIERIRFEAEFGVCDPEILGTIQDLVAPTGEEQLELGRGVYDAQCASCHGAQGIGDGPAAAALTPPPRNFQAPAGEWTNGTSALAIFNTLNQGIPGTSMPSYAHLPEAERWALVHYIREQFVPEANRQEAGEEDLAAVCRALSAPPRPPSIPIRDAMNFLAADADELRQVRLASYGAPQLSPDASRQRGEALYAQNCMACHGPQGGGQRNIGPYGSFPPFLYLNIGRLDPAAVGGTFSDVAERVTGGPHASLPNMTSVGTLSDRDWQDIQAYVAGFPSELPPDVRMVVPSNDEQPADGEQPSDEQPAEGQPTGEQPAGEQPADSAP